MFASASPQAHRNGALGTADSPDCIEVERLVNHKRSRLRAMVLRREAGRPAEKVLMALPILWTAEYEDDIQKWAKKLWNNQR